MESPNRRVSISASEDDEYHEDSLPDLVLDSFTKGSHLGPAKVSGERRESLSPVASSSSLDLLTLTAAETNEVADESAWNESDYLPATEVTTEISSRSGDLKISYVDHSKAYVAPGVEKYRSYLSLMPEDVEDDEADGGKSTAEEEEERRAQILTEFTALSFEEQRAQRIKWAQELALTVDEISEVKERLAFKTAWVGVLQRNLGISKWKKFATEVELVGEKVSKGLKETSASLAATIEATESRLLSSQSLQKAKDSFEQLSNEVKDRVKQTGEELVKKVSEVSLVTSSQEFLNEITKGQGHVEAKCDQDNNEITKT